MFSSKARVAEVDAQITSIDQALDESKACGTKQGELEGLKRDRLARIAVLREQVQQLRRSKEREKYREALNEMARRLRSSEEKLTEKQRVKLEQQMVLWQKQRDEDMARAEVEDRVLAEIEGNLTAARDRVRPLLNHRITKTVAGFLLWGWVWIVRCYRFDDSTAAAVNSRRQLTSRGDSHLSPTVMAGYPASWPLAQVFGVVLLPSPS